MGPNSLGRLASILAALLLFAGAAPAQPPAISIIIDDLGDRLAEGREAIALPGPVALAFLPESPFTPRLARSAHAAGKEILLHLPLLPAHGKAHPFSAALNQAGQVRDAALRRALAAVPFAQGVNNHQGSQLTERRDAMDWLMGALRIHGGLYFVDSVTTPRSVAFPAAGAQGLPATRRQVFLDDARNPQAIRKQFLRLLDIARRQGSALAIGHPYPETLAVLRAELPRLQPLGFELVTPSELIRRQERGAPIRMRELRLKFSTTLSAADAMRRGTAAGTARPTSVPADSGHPS